MVKAVWNGITIAESDDIVVVEGNAYFPWAPSKGTVLRRIQRPAPPIAIGKGSPLISMSGPAAKRMPVARGTMPRPIPNPP